MDMGYEVVITHGLELPPEYYYSASALPSMALYYILATVHIPGVLPHDYPFGQLYHALELPSCDVSHDQNAKPTHLWI